MLYKVKSGDSLSKIAKSNNTTVEALAKDNNISDTNLIRTGQIINIGEKPTEIAVDSSVIKDVIEKAFEI